MGGWVGGFVPIAQAVLGCKDTVGPLESLIMESIRYVT